MKEQKDFSMINCIAGSMLAYILTIPIHELYHLITDYIYGDKVRAFYATAVNGMDLVDLQSLAPFHRVMKAGGSASIINAITGVIVFIILLKVKEMSPMLRVVLIQYMGMQLCEGFGYFLIGGFGIGDWGNVFDAFPNNNAAIIARIGLVIIGGLSIPFIIFALLHFSYDFVEDPSDKNERKYVGIALHIMPFIFGTFVSVAMTFNSVIMEWMPLPIILIFQLIWIPFFWAGLYTYILDKMAPKESRCLTLLPKEPHIVFWLICVALILADFFVLAPGIVINP